MVKQYDFAEEAAPAPEKANIVYRFPRLKTMDVHTRFIIPLNEKGKPVAGFNLKAANTHPDLAGKKFKRVRLPGVGIAVHRVE